MSGSKLFSVDNASKKEGTLPKNLISKVTRKRENSLITRLCDLILNIQGHFDTSYLKICVDLSVCVEKRISLRSKSTKCRGEQYELLDNAKP